jgi:phosphotransferase system enzyme I (PtsI)
MRTLPEKNNFNMLRLKGTPFSSGLARGVAYVYSDILESKHAVYNIKKGDYKLEYARIHNAKQEVRQQLFSSAKRVGKALDKNVADIFMAQEAMLVDPQLASDLKSTLRQKHINAERVVGMVFQRWIRKFRDAPSTLLNERADDIEDLYRRMLGVLVGVEAHKLENLPENTILVARRLLPSDTVFLTGASCVGILLEIAGPTSHSTILARELGVPCVGQMSHLISRIDTGNEILVNGNTGKIVVNPSKRAGRYFSSERNHFARHDVAANRKRFETAVTVCGKIISVMANVGSREDIKRAVESGADDIGLFRTESYFLAAKAMPTAKEFARYLKQCLEPVGNRNVNLRLLDIGGDKNIPYLSLPFELNPFLGKRGVRLLFDFRALLKIQLEAMLSVSKKYRIRILIPMVTFPEEVAQIRQIIEKIAKKKNIKPPPLGAMIETPAAALTVASMREHADFLCIGTNDLTQYIMAADRESMLMSEYFKDDHPVILRLMQDITIAAGKSPVTLCGELAAKHEMLKQVLKTGITSLSIAPLSIPSIKEAIRHLEIR